MTIHQTSPSGLDGIPAAVTALSHVDGEAGELIIAGSRVGDLASTTSFEGVVGAAVVRCGAKTITEAEVRAVLAEARERAFQRLPTCCPPPRACRSSTASARRSPRSGRDGIPHEATIVGAMPVIVGALVRRADGQAGSRRREPQPCGRHAVDAARRTRRREAEATALDAYLVTVSDHGMNASTFTARVIASTQADLFWR